MKFKFNIPNKITIIRVALIPLFAFVLIVNIPYRNILAAFIFAMLSISDFLDGYFARKKKQVTEFGKLIDPIADKLLISTALIFLVAKGYPGISLWMAVTIIAREIIVTAMRVYMLPTKIVVPASNFGKAKTVVQSIAIVFVILQLPLSYYAMLAAVLLTLISGIEYIIRIKGMTGDKLVNLPNLITLCRFLFIIPFAYYFLNSKISISILIFAIITLSDKLDGISARLMNQKTKFGNWFDSFTDFTLVSISFFLFLIKDYLSPVWILPLIFPAISIPLSKTIFLKIQKKIPVTPIAKISSGMAYITIFSILTNFIYKEHLLIITFVLMYLSMFRYLFLLKNAFNKQKDY